MVESGFRLPWEDLPAPLSPIPIPSRPPASLEAMEVLETEVQLLLAKQAIEEVSLSPGFYGRLFVVPKSSGGFRPVLDLSALNNFLCKKPFRMETPWGVRESVRPGDWATSLDLTDAYFHVLVAQRDRKYLRFSWKSKIFQFRVLPFGLSLAPWVFTRITRELAIAFHSRGFRVRMYLDDWLVLASCRDSCQHHMDQVISLTTSLGFTPNWEKSALTPAQEFTFLGMLFRTVPCTVAPSRARLERFSALRDRLLSSKSASVRTLHSLLGQMESLAPLLPLGHLHKRSFQRELSCRWDQVSQSWDLVISLQDWLVPSLAQWTVTSWLDSCVPTAVPQHEVELYTDASTVGWGAHVENLTASGTWSQEERSFHINRLELEAVCLAVESFSAFLSQKVVLLCTDNTTVACYILKQGGTRAHHLSQRAEALLLRCQELGIFLRAKHVPGKINIVADLLSRPHCVLQTEWTLSMKVLEPVWSTWHRPMVDLFATRFNFRLPTYVSPVPDPGAWAVDALSMSWSGILAYAFPPFPILGKVIRKARIDQASLILVCPHWPAQPWFAELLQLSHLPPLPLRVDGRKALVQPRSGIPHGNPAVLKLHAWMLCGSACVHKAPQSACSN